MGRHANVPVFIPHLGCPNNCVFCDQKAISGTVYFDESSVPSVIEEGLARLGGSRDDVEIAFFGGSFTGIDRHLMIRLLNTAQEYVDRGLAKAIRMSTRPDYIDREIIEILKRYTVSEVELGIQSMNDNVLRESGRGHSSSDSLTSVRLLKENGFSFVSQMMIGLPHSSSEDEKETAEIMCSEGASGFRIYPTVVFKNTPLEKMTKEGLYSPLTVEEAVRRSADVLEILIENNVKCLRIGLCESENLHDREKYFAGPVHPAIGEMVKGEVYRRKIVSLLKDKKNIRDITLTVPRGSASAVSGINKANRLQYAALTGAETISIKEDASLEEYSIKIDFIESRG